MAAGNPRGWLCVSRRRWRRLARYPAHQRKNWTAKSPKSTHRLYRNNRNGTFTDITAASGLDIEMYGMGVAVADYDNDGREDIYITALEGDRLFHNEGNARFRDVTASAGIHNTGFGQRRLGGCRQRWPRRSRRRQLRAMVASVRPLLFPRWIRHFFWIPESYKGIAPKLYRNLGGGKFQDISQKAGIAI